MYGRPRENGNQFSRKSANMVSVNMVTVALKTQILVIILGIYMIAINDTNNNNDNNNTSKQHVITYVIMFPPEDPHHSNPRNIYIYIYI